MLRDQPFEAHAAGGALFSVAVVLSTLVAMPAYAQDTPRRDRVEREGPVGAAVDTAAGIAGAAVGTAGAIATAPFRDPNVDRRSLAPRALRAL